MSTVWPNKCTGIIAFVFFEIAFSSSFKSILKVCGSISTNTNLQFVYEAGQADEIKLNGVVIISSSVSGFKPRS